MFSDLTKTPTFFFVSVPDDAQLQVCYTQISVLMYRCEALCHVDANTFSVIEMIDNESEKNAKFRK